jgi:hypothetical protein
MERVFDLHQSRAGPGARASETLLKETTMPWSPIQAAYLLMVVFGFLLLMCVLGVTALRNNGPDTRKRRVSRSDQSAPPSEAAPSQSPRIDAAA